MYWCDKRKFTFGIIANTVHLIPVNMYWQVILDVLVVQVILTYQMMCSPKQWSREF